MRDVVLSTVLCVAMIVGCKSKPSALTVCEKLAATGAAANCKTAATGGIGAAASEKAAFDIPGIGADKGQVLRFDKSSDYEATVKAFDAMAVLAGRHRYGSASALILVQMNAETPATLGDAAKTVVEGL